MAEPTDRAIVSVRSAPVRVRGALFLLVAVALAALAAIQVGKATREVETRVGPLRPVVAVSRDIPRGRWITRANASSYLVVRQVAERFAPSAAFRSPEDLVGSRAAMRVEAGTYPAPGQFAAGDSGARVPASPGTRLIRVAASGVSASGVGVAPGARVDVVVTGSAAGGSSRVLLENVLVSAVDRLESPVAEIERKDGSAPAAGAAGVVLRVRPVQAVALAAAANFARDIRLLARPGGDRMRVGPLIVRAREFDGAP